MRWGCSVEHDNTWQPLAAVDILFWTTGFHMSELPKLALVPSVIYLFKLLFDHIVLCYDFPSFSKPSMPVASGWGQRIFENCLPQNRTRPRRSKKIGATWIVWYFCCHCMFFFLFVCCFLLCFVFCYFLFKVFFHWMVIFPTFENKSEIHSKEVLMMVYIYSECLICHDVSWWQKSKTELCPLAFIQRTLVV